MSPDKTEKPGPALSPEGALGAAQDILEKATGLGGMVPGGGFTVSPGVPSAQLVKIIHWDGSEWQCQSFGVRLLRQQKGESQPIEIDPKTIKFEDDRKWLEMGEPRKEEKAWIIPVKVKEGVQIAPNPQTYLVPAGSSSNPDQATYRLGEEVKPEPPRPSDTIEVKVTVTVPVQMDSSLVAATAMAGMIPGGGAVLGAGLPAMELKKEITYLVQPPQVTWRKYQHHPVRLDGLPPLSEKDLENLEEDPESFEVRSAPLPPGWDQGITVEAAISATSKKLEVDLARIEPVPGEETCLSARLKAVSRRLVIHPVEAIGPARDVVNAQVELVMVTRSRHLGVQVQKGLMLSAQALDVAVYYRNQPSDRHEWAPAEHFFTSDLAKVAVISSDKTNAPPDICKLGVSLRILPNWAEPTVRWYLEEAFISLMGEAGPAPPALDDKITPEAGLETMYQAPSSVVWQRGGKPARRNIICLVTGGAGNHKEPVPEHEDLYFAVPLKTEIDLAQRSRKVRLKIRLGPKDLLTEAGLDKLALKDQEGIKQSLIREFFLDLDFF